MQNILVTGGAGYIGSHTVAELLRLKYHPIVFDNLVNGHRAAVSGGDFIIGDLANREDLRETFQEYEIDAVIHFAAFAEVGESMEVPAKYYRNNLMNGINLLDTMIEFGVKKLVFSSTAAVYGQPKTLPILETEIPHPTNTYGFTKRTFEQILADYKRAYGLNSITLRYFNAAGAHPNGGIGEDHTPESHLIPLILQVALGQKPLIEVLGTDYDTPDGTCIRDYIHVMDLAQAHILAISALTQGHSGDIYNLGNGNGYSVLEVIRAAEKVVGQSIPYLNKPRRPGDPAHLVASATKIQQRLGWKPQYSELETIIKHAWNWHQRHPLGFQEGNHV